MKSVVITFSEDIYTRIAEMANDQQMLLEEFLAREILRKLSLGGIPCEICGTIILDQPIFRPGCKVIQCPSCGEEMELEHNDSENDED